MVLGIGLSLLAGDRSGHVKMRGLEQGLNVVLETERVQRYRYDASIASMTQAVSTGEENMMEDGDDSTANDSATLPANTSKSAHLSYITLAELEELLSTQNVIQPSKIELQNSLSKSANEKCSSILRGMTKCGSRV